jgi:hypothetical protein
VTFRRPCLAGSIGFRPTKAILCTLGTVGVCDLSQEGLGGLGALLPPCPCGAPRPRATGSGSRRGGGWWAGAATPLCARPRPAGADFPRVSRPPQRGLGARAGPHHGLGRGGAGSEPSEARAGQGSGTRGRGCLPTPPTARRAPPSSSCGTRAGAGAPRSDAPSSRCPSAAAAAPRRHMDPAGPCARRR